MDQSSRVNRDCLAVVANKSWYEAYIPLYLHFARRSCPHAHVIVYFMGTIDSVTRRAILDIGISGGDYTLVESYKPQYGSTAMAAKLARFTINDALIRAFDRAYIGDIDMLLAREEVDLFTQHSAHAKSLGIPISNVARADSERLTGLHFFYTKPYYDAVGHELAKLDHEIADVAALDLRIAYPTGTEDEQLLYRAVASARPDWIEKLSRTKFRPHHGTHMGQFRSVKNASYKRATERKRIPETVAYHSDTYRALRDGKVLETLDELLTKFPRLKVTLENFINFMERKGNDAQSMPTQCDATQSLR